jgi:phosphoribosyl-ATP pyrophosphohydrolase
MDKIFQQLETVLEERKNTPVDESYVASLYAKGLDEILKKIGEEATEVVIAAKDENKEKIIYEVSDLFFHTLVLLRQQNITLEEIEVELQHRFGLSGLIEKASRTKT